MPERSSREGRWSASRLAGALLAGLAFFGAGESVPCAEPVPLTHPAPGTAAFVGANFWNIDWEGPDDFFRSGVDFAVVKDPWRPELIQDLKPYRVLRFMDWNDTNGAQTQQAHWATRKPQRARQDQPVAYEWQIDLCNRANTDCWITLHHTANEDDWRQLARLVHGTLKPSLRLYVEWSNEVWNGGFPQSTASRAAGERLRLPGENKGLAHQVQVSLRAFEVFGEVFASDRSRLVTVLSGQAGWTGPCEAHLAALADRRINPQGLRPTVYAIAPYFSGTSIEQLRTSIPETRRWVQEHARCAQRLGVPLISYELGADSFQSRDCAGLQRDPAMRRLYVEYFDALAAAGLRGPFMQYTHTGVCWGLKQKTGDALALSPRYQGVLDWLASHDPLVLREGRP